MADEWVTITDEDEWETVTEEPTLIQKAGQAVKEVAAAPVRTVESMLGSMGGLMRMGAETAKIGDAVTKHINIPGANVIAEHLIRKYGPKKALSFYDARMKQYAGMGKKVSDFWDEQASKGWEAPNPEITEARWKDRPVSKTVSAVSSGLTSIGVVIGASFLTKSPHTGLAILAGSETGSMYDRLRKKNVEPGVASKLAQLAGAWTYATEKIGFDKLLAPGKRTILNVLKKSGWEGLQEVTETIGHNLLEYFGYDYKDIKSIPTAVKSAYDHAMDGWMDALVGGIGAGGITSIVLPGTHPTESKKLITTPPTVEEITGKTTEEIKRNALEATKAIPVTEPVSPGAAVEGEFTAEVAKSNNLPDTKKPLMAFKLGEDIVFSRDATSHANVPLTEKQHTQVVSPIKDPAGYVYEGKFYNREQWAEYQKAIKPEAPTEEGVKPAEKKRKPYQSQYAAGHEIPKLLEMKEGERRKLMKKETGVTSMKKMTPSTAQDYIDALHKLAREKGIETGILPSERKFKKPIIGFTPQLYKAKVLGVEFMTQPAVIGKQKLDIEFTEHAKQVDEMGKIINKLGGETRRTRATAKLKNKPTKSIERFAELLNKHEEAPVNLSEEEKKIFNYFRNLNRAILVRENEVREKLGIDPIEYKTGYIRHIVDTLAQDVMEGRHPIPEELKYWAEEHATKKIRNPMEFQRKLGDELEGIFSKDLVKATKAMLWTGLREIHLNEPLKHFENQMGLHSEVIPDSTRRWTEKFINQMVVGKQTATDKRLNEMVKESGIGGVINKILRPFGRRISNKPLTRLMSKAGRLQIYSVMGWRPKQLLRNKFQVVQNLALYTTKSNLKSYQAADKQLKEMLSESLFLKTYKGFEDLTEVDKHILGKLWLAPFQWTAVTNAKRAMKTAYYDTLELIEDPKYKKFGWANSERTYTEPKGFLYPSEKKVILDEMEFGAGCTQYHYIPMAMPGVFNYKVATPLTRLQSWWMNYFFKFHREAAHRFFKGETREGLKLPWSRRIGWGRYMVIGGLVHNTLGYTGSFLFGAAPEAVPPMFQLLYSMYKYIITDDDKTRASAKRKFLNALKTFIPGYLAYKDLKALLETDDWTKLMFYKKGIFAEEKPTGQPRRPGRVRPRRMRVRR